MTDPARPSAARRRRDVLLEGTRQAVSRHEYVQLVRSNRWWRALAVLGVIVVLVTAALGGFSKAPPPLPAPDADATVGGPFESRDVGQYTVTPFYATVEDRKPGQRHPGSTPKRYLVLKLMVRNQSSTGRFGQVNLAQDLVWLRNGRSEEKTADEILWEDTLSRDIVLQPGLESELIALWNIPDGEILPEAIEIGVRQRARGERNTVGEAFLGEWRRTGKGRLWRLSIQPLRASS